MRYAAIIALCACQPVATQPDLGHRTDASIGTVEPGRLRNRYFGGTTIAASVTVIGNYAAMEDELTLYDTALKVPCALYLSGRCVPPWGGIYYSDATCASSPVSTENKYTYYTTNNYVIIQVGAQVRSNAPTYAMSGTSCNLIGSYNHYSAKIVPGDILAVGVGQPRNDEESISFVRRSN